MPGLYRAQIVSEKESTSGSTGIPPRGSRLALLSTANALAAIGCRIYSVNFSIPEGVNEKASSEENELVQGFAKPEPFQSFQSHFTGLSMDTDIDSLSAAWGTDADGNKVSKLHVVATCPNGNVLYAEGYLEDESSWKRWDVTHVGAWEDGLMNSAVLTSDPSLFVTTHLFSGKACVWKQGKCMQELPVKKHPLSLALSTNALIPTLVIAEHESVAVWRIKPEGSYFTFVKRANYMERTTSKGGMLHAVGVGPRAFAFGGENTTVQLRDVVQPDNLQKRWPTGAKYEISHLALPSGEDCCFACGTDNEVLVGSWTEQKGAADSHAHKRQKTERGASSSEPLKAPRKNTTVLFRGDSRWIGLCLLESQDCMYVGCLTERGSIYLCTTHRMLDS